MADSNNTTSLSLSDNPTAAPAGLARRAFVTAIAGGAAAAMVVPVAALASGEPDPIFKEIEAHREAQEAHAAACHEQSRREDILIDEGIGLCPFVTMVWQGRPMVAHSHKQIDAYDCISEKVRTKAHAELDTTLTRYREDFGNIENESGDLGSVAVDAFYDMISTPPTSIAGLRALLTYLSEDVVDLGHLWESDTIEMFIHSLHDALLELHPAA
jgi:hypothetical protein